jgi:hypothetical protein
MRANDEFGFDEGSADKLRTVIEEGGFAEEAVSCATAEGESAVRYSLGAGCPAGGAGESCRLTGDGGVS